MSARQHSCPVLEPPMCLSQCAGAPPGPATVQGSADAASEVGTPGTRQAGALSTRTALITLSSCLLWAGGVLPACVLSTNAFCYPAPAGFCSDLLAGGACSALQQPSSWTQWLESEGTPLFLETVISFPSLHRLCRSVKVCSACRWTVSRWTVSRPTSLPSISHQVAAQRVRM